jgi:hypothetical protein
VLVQFGTIRAKRDVRRTLWTQAMPWSLTQMSDRVQENYRLGQNKMEERSLVQLGSKFNLEPYLRVRAISQQQNTPNWAVYVNSFYKVVMDHKYENKD